MTQLELPSVVRGRLREALEWVLENECEDVEAITIENDYKIRIAWLLTEFGDCPLADVSGAKGYEHMLRIFKREKALGEKGLCISTLKKRFVFLRRALKSAGSREIIKRDQVPDMPRRKIDTQPQTEFHTLEEYRRLRHALPSDWHRFVVDLAYWTGFHKRDLEETKKKELDLHRPIRDENGKVVGHGMFWMRNTKTKKHTPSWLPMDEQFRQCVLEYFEAHPELKDDDFVVGPFKKPRQWLRPGCRRAAVKELPLKNFRQSRSKYLEDQGLGLDDIRYMIGHVGKDPRVTLQHYLGSAPGPGTITRIHQQLNGSRKPAKHREPGAQPAVEETSSEP